MGRPIANINEYQARARQLLRYHNGNQEHARMALGVSPDTWQKIMAAFPPDESAESRPSDDVAVLLQRTADLAVQLGQLINAITLLVLREKKGNTT